MQFTTKADGTWAEFIEYEETNEAGEKLTVEVKKILHDLCNPKSLMNLWVKAGYLRNPLKSHWSIETEITRPDGVCVRAYNPMTMMIRRLDRNGKTLGYRTSLNFDWMMEATPENRDKLLREVERRFVEMTPETILDEPVEDTLITKGKR